MHISVMWLRVPGELKRGVNVVIRKHPGLQELDIGQIVDDPSKENIIACRHELKPGGNRVEASLDLVFEDRGYDPDAIDKQLKDVEMSIYTKYTHLEPMRFKRPLGQSPMQGVFETYLGPLSADSARAIFSLLRGTLGMFLDVNPEMKALAAA